MRKLKNAAVRVRNRWRALLVRLRHRASTLWPRSVARPPLWSFPPGLAIGDIQRSGVRYIENFCSPEEAERLIEIGRDRVQPSTVIGPGGASIKHDYRTSSDTFIQLSGSDPLIAELVNRASVFLGVPADHAERFSITRYQHNEYYKSHLDHDGTLKADRLYTVLLYLNSLGDDEGGGTVFEKLNLLAKPVRGRALCWINSYPDKTPRPETVHSALPVLRAGAEKWVAQMWFRAYKVAPVRTAELGAMHLDGEPLSAAEPLPAGISAATSPLPENL